MSHIMSKRCNFKFSVNIDIPSTNEFTIYFYCKVNKPKLNFILIEVYLCKWIDDHWKNKHLVWEKNTKIIESYRKNMLCPINPTLEEVIKDWRNMVVIVPFKPTVKNIAKYLTTIIGPAQLADEPIELVKVVVEIGNLCESYTVDWLNDERVAKGWFPI